MALGPLGLSHEDLWHVTYGQLTDKIIAYNYNAYLRRREAAIAAAYAAIWQNSTQSYTLDDLCGVWDGVKIVEETEYKRQQLAKIRGGTRGRLK